MNISRQLKRMGRGWLTGVGIALLFGAVGHARAATVYDNGPINGTTNGWFINQGFQISDSFTLTGSSNLTEAQIGLWIVPGDTPLTVDWSIGSAALGSDLASGAGASLTNTFQYTNIYGYEIYQSTFPISASLNPGTYWLTLQNATGTTDPIAWDENDGPSAANQFYEGSPSDTPVIGSQSFQLYDAAVPEPASLCLLGLGGLTLIGRRRRIVHA